MYKLPTNTPIVLEQPEPHPTVLFPSLMFHMDNMGEEGHSQEAGKNLCTKTR